MLEVLVWILVEILIKRRLEVENFSRKISKTLEVLIKKCLETEHISRNISRSVKKMLVRINKNIRRRKKHISKSVKKSDVNKNVRKRKLEKYQ